MYIIAEPKGKGSNRDALSFRMGMYIHSLRNAILCLCMYIRNACTIQSYARVCISVMLVQIMCNLVAKMCPRERSRPQTAWSVPEAFQVYAPLIERQLQLSRQLKDRHCKMAALEALLFDMLIIVFLCISTCIQRTKNI